MSFVIWEVGFYDDDNASIAVAHFLFQRRAHKYFERMMKENQDLKWYCGGDTVFI